MKYVIALVVLAAGTQIAAAQGPGGQPGGTGSSSGSSGSTSQLGTAVQAQQQLAVPGPAVNPSSSTSQGGIDASYRGSLVEGKATADVLQLSIDEAIQRGWAGQR